MSIYKYLYPYLENPNFSQQEDILYVETQLSSYYNVRSLLSQSFLNLQQEFMAHTQPLTLKKIQETMHRFSLH